MNDQTFSKEEDFLGIWNRRDQKPSKISETAMSYAEPGEERGLVQTKKTKGWGFGSVFTTIIVFIVVQVIVAIPFLSGLATDPSKAVDSLASSPWLIIVSSVAMYSVWIGGMITTTYRKGMKNFFKEYWVSFKKYDLIIGAMIAAALYGAVFLLSWLASDVLKLDMSGSSNGAVFAAQQGIWLIILAGVLASFAGPLFEELFFRGYALQGILNSFKNALNRSEASESKIYQKFIASIYKSRYVVAVIGSSFIFGLMHFQGVEHFGQWFVVIVTGLLGVVLAMSALYFKRLGPGIFAHMLYNGATLLIGLALMNQ